MLSAHCLLLDNGSLNTFPQKQTLGTIGDLLLDNGSLNTFPQKQSLGTTGDLLLDNGAVNSLCQQYRLFSMESVKNGYKGAKLRLRENENAASPRQSRKKISAEDRYELF
jgi:hypothetical protein